MLRARIPSYESYRIGVRPAILTSLKQMLQYMDIDFNHKIFFNGEAEVSKLLGGEYNDRRGSDLGTDVGYSDKIFVELDSSLAGYNDELDNLTGNSMNPPLWLDRITGTSITPKFNTRKYTLTINKYFKDRVTAERFYTNIRSKTLGTHNNSLFALETHFPITYDIMNLLIDVYERLVNAGVVKVDYDTWLMENSLTPSGFISNLIGENRCFVFKQRLEGMKVVMENPNLAKVTKGTYIGKYEVSFDYWFFFSEHKEWEIKYPIQIYQQVMPEEWIPEIFEENELDTPTRMFYEAAASNRVFGYMSKQTPYYHVLPSQDNWRPDPEPWMNPQLQVLISVEDVDNQVLLNIKNINGFTWDPTVLHYIMKYRTKVTRDATNPMQFKVYSDDTIVAEEQILLLENGDLVLTRKPTMSAIYRVTFNFDYALRQYNEECVEDILQDPDYGKWIIEILFPEYEFDPDHGWNGKWDWVDIHNDIEVGDGDPIYPIPNGMLYASIIAHNSQSWQEYLRIRNSLNGTNRYR